MSWQHCNHQDDNLSIGQSGLSMNSYIATITGQVDMSL